MKKLYGVTVAMITPFDKDGNIKINGLRDHAKFLIDKGVDCLYPLGTTGEMLHLDVDERKLIIETIIEEVDGRVPVYAHIGAACMKDVLELASHAYKSGADGVGIVTPVFHAVNNRELEEYYVSIARSLPDDFPVYLYNIPQCSGNDLQVKVVDSIVRRCENVIGIKYSYPDFIRTQKYINVNNGDFSVLHGMDKLFVALLAMGCEGTVSGVASVFPELYVDIYRAFKDNDLNKARAVQNLAIKYTELLRNGTNMAYFKEALKWRGIDVGYMRKPQLDLTREEKIELCNSLELLGEEGYWKNR